MKITDKKIVEKLIYLSKNGSSKQERMRAHAIILSNEGKKGRELATIFNVTIIPLNIKTPISVYLFPQAAPFVRLPF